MLIAARRDYKDWGPIRCVVYHRYRASEITADINTMLDNSTVNIIAVSDVTPVVVREESEYGRSQDGVWFTATLYYQRKKGGE